MNANWHKNLTKYWFKIELETKQILRLVKDDFQSVGMTFDGKFKDYFVRGTNNRIAQTFDQFVSDFEFEEQFVGIQFAQAPAIQNPIVETNNAVNSEMELTVVNQRMAESILNGVYVPGDESMQRFASFLGRNVSPNNVTSTVESMLGNVSTSVFRTRQNTSTDVNGNEQNENFNTNHLAQKENDTIPALKTVEFADEFGQNRSTIDPIVPASSEQANSTATWPQGLPTSTPFHGMVEERDTNALLYPTFQPVDSFMNRNIGPNDVTLKIDAMLGNASKLLPQSDQSQAIDANEAETQGEASAFVTENTNTMMPSDAIGLEFSDLADITLMDALQIEPIDIELPNDTTFGDAIGIDKTILAKDLATSSDHINESTTQMRERMDLTRQDVQTSSGTSDQIDAVHPKGKQRRKRKFANLATADGNAKKKRRTGLRSTLETIPESISEVALIDLTLNESCEQESSTGVGKQGASTSNVNRVAKKKSRGGKNAGGCGSKEHKCAFCEYIAVSESALITHTRKHTGDKPFKCEVCARGFTQEGHRKNHMKTHANEFQFHCSNCLQGFNDEKAKEAHERSCNRRRYECYLCKYSAFNKQYLVKHMPKHTGDKPFKCEVCARGFTEKRSLKPHMRTHANEFQFHCSNCLQGFNDEKAKEVHERSCNRRRYECYLCKYSTFSKQNLYKHMPKHTGDKPFRCSHCLKQFTQKSNLNCHLKRYND